MAVLTAIFGILLLGVVAMATDLSVSTHYKRSLQNVTDAAALGAAEKLPASPTTGPTGDQAAAAKTALELVHNTYPWPGFVVSNLLTAATCTSSGCSITVCAGMSSSSPCTQTVGAAPDGPFVLTVNTPPQTARVAAYDGDVHRVEVVMRQQTGGFFAAFVGGTDQDAAQSVAYHFAAGQPFPFALYSKQYVLTGNQTENIVGNIYAARYLSVQSTGGGFGVICASEDSGGNGGYIVLGNPQTGESGYNAKTDPGQFDAGTPITATTTCPTSKSGGNIYMQQSTANCAAAYPGNNSGSSLYADNADHACEANPPLQPPAVTTPTPPVYSTVYCGSSGFSGGLFQPGEYGAVSGSPCNQPLNIDNAHLLSPGIYEIDPVSKSGGCDVQISDTGTSFSITQDTATLKGATFYLKGGAGICVSFSSTSVVISQNAFTKGDGSPGDGRYAVYSDNAGTPTVTVKGPSAGPSSGMWNVTGVIWLPTGVFTATNKAMLSDSGQVIVKTWNDKSGNHNNPSVTYNPGIAPPQTEILELAE